MTHTDTEAMDTLVDGILPHVPFDGWSRAAFDAAVSECGIEHEQASRICPRGALDLAVRHHVRADERLSAALGSADLEGLRYSEKVGRVIELRLDLAGDKEIVRRATAMFALPHLAVEGASLIWGTSDAIWNALGDTSKDINWYSKRAILSSVYGSTVLFWLGDTSGGEETGAFIARRIENVMQFEKFKSTAKASKILGPIAAGIEKMTQNISAPSGGFRSDFPGYHRPQDMK